MNNFLFFLPGLTLSEILIKISFFFHPLRNSCHKYLDMQDADHFEFANSDPKGFLKSHATEHGLIIDEAQYAPPLFSQIKVEVDKNRRPGYYILSGSQNFLLHEKISESLAGRVYFYTLLPLSMEELKTREFLLSSPEEQILKGFYPHVYQPHITMRTYYENYIVTYVERDIRNIKNISNIAEFKKFIQLCALRIGTTLNIADLAVNCGISPLTARSWLGLLETSFIIFLLQPYHNNLGKRIIKAPKIYFYDTGLAAAIMNLEQNELIVQRERFGALFENMVIIDILKQVLIQEIKPTITFFRDSNHNEIDLIIEIKGKTIPVEIKASSTVNPRFFDTITWFANTMKNSSIPAVIYGGTETHERSYGRVIAWSDLAQLFKF